MCHLVTLSRTPSPRECLVLFEWPLLSFLRMLIAVVGDTFTPLPPILGQGMTFLKAIYSFFIPVKISINLAFAFSSWYANETFASCSFIINTLFMLLVIFNTQT